MKKNMRYIDCKSCFTVTKLLTMELSFCCTPSVVHKASFFFKQSQLMANSPPDLFLPPPSVTAAHEA